MITVDNVRISQMRSAKKQEDIYHAYASRHGVSDSFLFLMYIFFVDGDGETQTEIGQILNAPKQTVNSSLKKMESEGYIRLSSDKSDKKKKRVYLTELGTGRMNELIIPLIDAENMAYERIGMSKAVLLSELCRQETEALKEQIEGLR